MSFLAEYGLFILKAISLGAVVLFVFGGILALSRKPKAHIEIESFDATFKTRKKQIEKAKKSKKDLPSRFVLHFKGDISATEVEQLRDEVSMILSTATPKDEVVVCVESPGGSVSGYGLAASQLARIRHKKIPLTVCIDVVAASGGYLMACVANQILAAPFAIIGSIGVVAQMPNFHRLLKRNNIDIELLTAGKYKRTLTMLGENTKKDREKFQEDLEAIHDLFKNHVTAYRKKLNLEQVATGEHWLGEDALNLKLVDKIKTSDDYLFEGLEKYNTVLLSTPVKKPMMQKVFKPLSSLLRYERHHL